MWLEGETKSWGGGGQRRAWRLPAEAGRSRAHGGGESGQGEGSWVRAVTPMLVLEVPLTRCGLRRLSTPQWPTCPLVVGSHNAERDASPGGSGQQRTHDRLQE